MHSSAQTPSWDHLPFLRILPPFALGILLYGWVRTPHAVLYGAALGVYLIAYLGRHTRWNGWFFAGALFLTGMGVTALHVTLQQVPRHHPIELRMEIEEDPRPQSPRYCTTTARILAFRDSAADAPHWRTSHERVKLYIAASLHLAAGDRLWGTGILRPVDTTASRYGALMRSRGIGAQLFLAPVHLHALQHPPRMSIHQGILMLHRWAVHRLKTLPLSPDAQAILLALVAGEKQGVSSTLKADYAATGTAHLLAVSGLHMGFILLFGNLLFGGLLFGRQGHRLRNFGVILLLWLYAALTGFSASVIRAALMLSAAQWALASSLRGNGYNLLLGCATVMLAANPFYLYDVSFQLSFAAVLSILFFFPRLYRKPRQAWWGIETLYSSFLLGVAAQIGTLPLLLYHFGLLSWIGLWINPIVILTSFFTIFVGLLWLMVGWSGFAGGVGWVLEHVLHFQNDLIARAAAFPGGSIRTAESSGFGLILGYGLLALIAIGWKLWEMQRDPQSSTPPLRTEPQHDPGRD